MTDDPRFDILKKYIKAAVGTSFTDHALHFFTLNILEHLDQVADKQKRDDAS